MSCGVVHGDGDPRTGTPLCLDCYDHTAQVAWNAFVPKLWTRTIDAVKRELRRLRGLTAAPRPGSGTRRSQSSKPAAPCTCTRWSAWTATTRRPGRGAHPAELGDRRAAEPAAGRRGTSTAIRTPRTPDQPDGWVVQWGEQVRPLTVARGLPGAEVTEQHVAGYLAKYATKATEPPDTCQPG